MNYKLKNTLIIADVLLAGIVFYSEYDKDGREVLKFKSLEIPLKSPTTPRPMLAGDASLNKIPVKDI